MIAIVTTLVAFPLGRFVRSWLAAKVAYTVAYWWMFTMRTLYLLLRVLDAPWADNSFSASQFPWCYGLVTLGVLVVGLALVAAAHKAGARRRPAPGLGGRVPATQASRVVEG